MGLSLLASQRSKDPNTKVGATIVNDNNRIISIGYNGFPNNCSDDILPWNKNGDFKEIKYSYVVHAELNAILSCNNNNNLENCMLYVTLFPCNECAKAIVQSGIKKIYYLDGKYDNTDSAFVSRKIFDLADVRYEKYIPERKNIEIKLEI